MKVNNKMMAGCTLKIVKGKKETLLLMIISSEKKQNLMHKPLATQLIRYFLQFQKSILYLRDKLKFFFDPDDGKWKLFKDVEITNTG